jgi:sugar/nucleoside kinase (ribokinase family)
MKQQTAHKSRTKVVGTGLFALDLVIGTDGQLLSYGLGGSAGNVLAILAKFNWDAVPVVELGQDPAANLLLQEFTHLNIDQSFVHTSPKFHTPVIYQHQQKSDSDRTHKFSFSCPHCGEKRSMMRSATSVFDTNLPQQRPPQVLYLDRATRMGVELAELYKDKNVLVVFEPSEIGNDSVLFQRALNAANIVKYADDRLDDLASFSTAHISVEICTMGSNGLRYRAPSLGDDWVTLSAYHAPKVVDTAGAGDWCTAGMIQYLVGQQRPLNINAIKYNQLHKALRFGQALSALNCMTVGAMGLTKTIPLTDIKEQAKKLMSSKVVDELKCNTHEEITRSKLIDELLPKKLRSQLNFDVGDDICCSVLI